MSNPTAPAEAPARTYEQRRDALRKANMIRTYRARVKDEIKTGSAARDPRNIIMSPDAPEETWKVFDLLIAMPKVGRVKANKILRAARISPSKTLGGMTDRQRDELLALLPTGRR